MKNEVKTSSQNSQGSPLESERKILVRTPHPDSGDEIREMTEEEIRIEVEDGEMLIDEDTDELVKKDEIPEETKRVRRQKRATGG